MWCSELYSLAGFNVSVVFIVLVLKNTHWAQITFPFFSIQGAENQIQPRSVFSLSAEKVCLCEVWPSPRPIMSWRNIFVRAWIFFFMLQNRFLFPLVDSVNFALAIEDMRNKHRAVCLIKTKGIIIKNGQYVLTNFTHFSTLSCPWHFQPILSLNV